MATHSSILAWRIPWTEKLHRLQSTRLQRVGNDWSDLASTQGAAGLMKGENKMFIWSTPLSFSSWILEKFEALGLFKFLKVKVIQLCPTLWDTMDYTVHEILQAGILEWVAFSSPGNLPNPGIEPRSPTLQADSLPSLDYSFILSTPLCQALIWEQ